VVVDPDYEIVHLSESARRFLRFVGGEPTRNLLRVVSPMLRIELRAALYRATQAQEIAEVNQVPMELDNETYLVNIRVLPAADIAPNFILVIFETHKPSAGAEIQAPRTPEGEFASRELERELEGVKSHLREIVEQYEASTEDLKASIVSKN
jgi:two-component system CheB/CheR fusion protein